ncbi:MAG: DUF2459 domain-containing protein [Gammaproteobacteria bacterium]
MGKGIISIKPTEPLWVLDSGWHTGLILARSELGRPLAGLLQRLPHSQYFAFGWGNRKFYIAPHPTLGMDIAALFPSHSVVLVDGCDVAPRACLTSQVRLRSVSVSTNGIKRLDDFLAHSLQKNAHGNYEPVAPGPDPDSEFFASGLSYDALHTCNTWTAEALQAAGLPVSYHGVIFANQIWRQVK